ncbi:hypothetical protein I5M32_05160 [Pedobacter sp. SD-b]|uniref:Uncharacterized protein n=1 Tax=Pedobacter segetis TaxID=2793069 RepID=A0ABS1BJG2_9SPHI|nr:hypothetical protein [Pedobacter segetis]MBK0382344.1 hypothetical protein [Pedobacter segetis]
MMEEQKKAHLEKKSPEGVEEDYDKNKENNPSPAEEAITEKNDKPAGLSLTWILVICVIILFIVYFVIRNN